MRNFSDATQEAGLCEGWKAEISSVSCFALEEVSDFTGGVFSAIRANILSPLAMISAFLRAPCSTASCVLRE